MRLIDQRERERRERQMWLKQLADVAGAGGAIDRADIEALPEAHRGAARTIERAARVIFEEGQQAEALEFARERFDELAERIGSSWSPPDEGPDAAVLDRIRGAF
jgi:hypothetical protein